MWSSAGTYTVTLRVENPAGFDEATKTVTIVPPPPDPPVASFSVPSATIPVNSVMLFNDTSTNGPAQWSWNFGDGTTSSVQNPPHAFSAPGNYQVQLTVTNAGGSDTFTQTIRVIDPPIANFGTTINELVVDFSDSTANGPTSWTWDFGDGTSSTAQNPSKTYAVPGTYTVTLVASNAAGSSSPFISTVTVAEAPDAFFSSTTASLTASFTDTSVKNPTSWSWDFGDGTTSSSQNPSHNYTSPGTYTVELTVSNAAGSDTTTQNVTVSLAPPVALFTCTSVGGGVACDGTTSTGATSYSWTAPAASFSANTATATPSFTFLTSGTYPITLVVTNAAGVTDTMTLNHTVTVPQPPTISNINIVSNANGVVALSATASESPTSWTWTTPGAAIAGGATASPTLTYTTSGTKTITAVATNAVGSSAPFTITAVVTISMPPVVTSVTESSNSGGVVALVGAATNSPTSWAWSLPGGTLSSGGGTGTPTFSFSANGSYPGTVTATNADGTSASYSFTVTVSDLVPVVTSVTETSNAGGSAVMSGVATNSPTSWSWTITGGTVSAGAGTSTPTLTFTANGTYSGTATATNANGSSTAFPFTVTITSFLPPPTANFTWVQLSPALQIQFTDTSTAQTGATYTWNFGGGTQTGGSAQSPIATYTAPGTYTVTLTVTDGGGSNTSTQTITVV